jgi:hypothetical protein
MRFDKRMRMATKYKIVNRHPPLCGAEATYDDVDRDTAAHCLKYAHLKPEWSADLCPACVALMTAKERAA